MDQRALSLGTYTRRWLSQPGGTGTGIGRQRPIQAAGPARLTIHTRRQAPSRTSWHRRPLLRTAVSDATPLCQFARTLITAALLTLAQGAVAGNHYVFDGSGYLGDATLLPDWSATMLREAEQAAGLDACMADAEACPRHYRGLRHLLLRADAIPADRQIRLINHYVNRKRYANDRTRSLETPLSDEAVRYRSRWATVEEFMRRGGDCEDYATTKYYLLRRLGFEAEALRVVVTWDRKARGYHAVLAVHHDDEVLLLESDNTVRRGRNHTYRFVYSVNENSIWDHEAAAESARNDRKRKRSASASNPKATASDPTAATATTRDTAKG